MSKRIAFAVGTGRCGTNFLHNLLDKHKNVVSSHERLALNDTFMRYVKWYDLDIDLQGSLEVKKKLIDLDHSKSDLSFESSPYLSICIQELYNKFKCKFILLVRDPKKVVNSFVNKSWYEHKFIIEDASKVPSFQPFLELQPHHSFSRLIGHGEDFETWKNLTQIGKLAYFYKSINDNCLQQLKYLPEDTYKVTRIEDFDYENYLDTLKFLEISQPLSERKFNKIVNKKHNMIRKSKGYEWSAEDKEQFQFYTKDLAEQFGY